MQPQEFSRLISRFYGTAARVSTSWDGIVDKFVGDEAVALFVPGFAGEEHALARVGAAQLAPSRDLGNDGSAPPGPDRTGVHTGVAYVGRVGEGDACDFTAVGDAVNTTARLARRPAPERSSSARRRPTRPRWTNRARVPDAHASREGRDDRSARPRRQVVVLAHVAAKRRSSSSTSSAHRRAFGSVTSLPHGERNAIPCTPPGIRT